MPSTTVQTKILIPWHDVISEQVYEMEKQQKQLEGRIGAMQAQLSQMEKDHKEHHEAIKAKTKSGWFS